MNFNNYESLQIHPPHPAIAAEAVQRRLKQSLAKVGGCCGLRNNSFKKGGE